MGVSSNHPNNSVDVIRVLFSEQDSLDTASVLPSNSLSLSEQVFESWQRLKWEEVEVKMVCELHESSSPDVYTTVYIQAAGVKCELTLFSMVVIYLHVLR